MNSLLFTVRTITRHCLLDIISARSKPKPGIHFLNGHFLSLNDEESPEIFERLLDGLQNAGVRFINFADAAEKLKSRNIPGDMCLVAFSWDDGFEECFTKIRPVLISRNIKAAFFINPNFIDGDKDYRENFTKKIVLVDKPPMTWDQLQILSTEGHIIGAHTLDHINLNTNDLQVLVSQINGAKEVIQNRLGLSCDHFAFPFGRPEHISEEAVQIVADNFTYIYSQSDYRHYFSFDGRLINRRHFECDWPLNHVLYFLKNKSF